MRDSDIGVVGSSDGELGSTGDKELAGVVGSESYKSWSHGLGDGLLSDWRESTLSERKSRGEQELEREERFELLYEPLLEPERLGFMGWPAWEK